MPSKPTAYPRHVPGGLGHPQSPLCRACHSWYSSQTQEGRSGLGSDLAWHQGWAGGGNGEVVISLAGRRLGLWVRDWDSMGVRVWELPVSFRASYFASVSGYKLMHSKNFSADQQPQPLIPNNVHPDLVNLGTNLTMVCKSSTSTKFVNSTVGSPLFRESHIVLHSTMGFSQHRSGGRFH